MSLSTVRGDAEIGMLQSSLITDQPTSVHLLTNEHEAEALAFLAARPVHTVGMASSIRDNGLVSLMNRGSFYAYRGDKGRFEGVALIGHATLLEAHSEDAMAVFARLAHNCSFIHLIRAQQEQVASFWRHYEEAGRAPRLICRELLLEQRTPSQQHEDVPGLRLATFDDLVHVMLVNAAMAVEESAINPMERDPHGFRQRSLRRIKQGRVWLWIENGRLIFKADIMAETPEAIYLEGIYVSPEDRGKGYGLRCMSQLSRTLLARAGSLCLTVNPQLRSAEAFYHKVGYKVCSHYDTIYLRP